MVGLIFDLHLKEYTEPNFHNTYWLALQHQYWLLSFAGVVSDSVIRDRFRRQSNWSQVTGILAIGYKNR